MPDNNQSKPPGRRLGPWGWVALVALFTLLVFAIWYCAHAWSELPGVGIPPMGWLFLGLGVLLTIVVGAGLMFLLFYSSRKGRDF
jgi:protein-S-isoprenylcysteine O-methyltransferase Ste14